MSINIDKIELVITDQTEELRPYINKILEALGHEEGLVTDESVLRDFMDVFWSETEVEIKTDSLRDELEVEIHDEYDTLVDVAERMRDLETHEYVLDMSEEDIDCIIREEGGDPEEYARKSKEVIDKAMEEHRRTK